MNTETASLMNNEELTYIRKVDTLDKGPEDERLSLKNYVRADNPPIFFMEAQREHLLPSEYTLEISRRQRAMGVRSHWKVYKDVEHGFFFELKRRAQIEAFEDVCKFMEGELETL